MQLEVMITVSNTRRPQVLFGDLTDVFTPFVMAVLGLGCTLKVVYVVVSVTTALIFNSSNPISSKILENNSSTNASDLELPSCKKHPTGTQ